jgi:hypothetical protein
MMRGLSSAAGAPVTSTFDALARLRHGRVFHPRGVLLQGEFTARSAGPLPLPAHTLPVVARLSKGAGTPGSIPDILGLALRISSGNGPWDFTFASAGSAPIARMLLHPATSWSRAHYSSLAPYRANDSLVWLLAKAEDGPPNSDASLADVARLSGQRFLRFTVSSATVAGQWEAAADVRLHSIAPDCEHPNFDPMTHHPPSMSLYPRWLSGLRERAYRGSRHGRGAGS